MKRTRAADSDVKYIDGIISALECIEGFLESCDKDRAKDALRVAVLALAGARQLKQACEMQDKEIDTSPLLVLLDNSVGYRVGMSRTTDEYRKRDVSACEVDVCLGRSLDLWGGLVDIENRNTCAPSAVVILPRTPGDKVDLSKVLKHKYLKRALKSFTRFS